MKFLNTEWLYAIPAVLLILLTLFYLNRRARKTFFKNFASTKLLPQLLASYSPTRYILKKIFTLLAIILLLLAIARPQWGYRWEEQQAMGIDIIFALDTSKSMLAEDIQPNRLERAKLSILDLLPKLKGDRIGLVAFAGNAFLQCPLTHDYAAFRHSLDVVDTNIISQGGTDIANAITTAENAYPKQHNYKFLILITDGEDLEESAIQQAKRSAKNDVIIYPVGVGTPEGEIIPIKKEDGSTDFVRDQAGKIVKTKLDEETLKKIAQETDGFYTPLGKSGDGLEIVYNAGLSTIPQQDLNSSLKKVPLERFQWAIGGSLLFFIIEFIMGNRKLAFRRRKTTSTLIIIFTLIITLNTGNNLEASPSKAMEAYEDGDFIKAQELYEKALSKHSSIPEYNYNLATALYQNKEYKEAAKYFEEALTSTDLVLQENALYNMGNADYRLGEQLLETDKEQTIHLWENALKHYEAAIDLDESDIDSQENHAFVTKKLEALKQEDPPEENQNEEQEEDQKEDSPPKDQQNKDEEQKDNEESPKKEEEEQNQSNKQENQKEEEEEEHSHRNEGVMTHEEAKQLLESQKDAEKQLTLVPASSENSQKQSKFTKDW